MNKSRQEANKELLKELEWFIDKCPDQRFGQILCNYFFPSYQKNDIFFDESVDTLNTVKTIREDIISDIINL